MRISLPSFPALIVALCGASTAFAAPGTPFYSSGPGMPWGYSGYTCGGAVLRDGVHFNVPSEDRLIWGVVGAADWNAEPVGTPVAAVHDLRLSPERRPAWETVQVAVAPNALLSLRHTGDELKSELQLLGADRASFFWEGITSAQLSDGSDELIATFQGGSVRETGLRCWQPLRGGDVSIPCRFSELRNVSAHRFEYDVVTVPVDPSAPVVIDPTFVWTMQLGGTGREDYPRVVAQDFGPQRWVQFVAGTYSPLSEFSAIYIGNPQSGTSDVLLGTRDIANPAGAWDYLIAGGNRTDSPRDIVQETASDVCVLGVTASDLPSLGNSPNPPERLGNVNDGGGVNNGFIFCTYPLNPPQQHFIVFGGSGQDEPLAMARIGPYSYLATGWTRSIDFCGSCSPPSAGGTGFMAKINVGVTLGTSTWSPLLYPAAGTQSQVTDAVKFGGRMFAVSPNSPSSTDHRLELLEIDPNTLQTDVRATFTGPFDPFYPALVASPNGLFVIGSTDGGLSGAPVQLNAPMSDAGFPASDGFVARVIPQDGGTAVVPWLRYVGGGSVDQLLTGAATDEDELLFGGYSYSQPSDLGVTFGGPPSVVGAGSRMLIGQLSKDGAPRWVNLVGGPNGQDQAVSMVLTPDAGTTTRPVILMGWLDGSNDGGSYPAVQNPWSTTSDRQLGLFRFLIETNVPQPWLDAGSSEQSGSASFQFGASFSGSGYLRALIPSLTGPDGGEFPLAPPDVRGTLVAGPYTATATSLDPGVYTAKVRAISRDGYEASASTTITVLPLDAGVPDAGPGAVDAGGEVDGGPGSVETDGGDAGSEVRTQRSPGGCSCDSSSVGIPMIALAMAMVAIGRRRSRNSAE